MALTRAQSGVTISGLDDAKAAFARMARGASQAANAQVLVGSPLQYAYGIETGRHRGGRLARRAGGVFYLTRATEHVIPTVRSRMATAVKDGAVLPELIKVGFDIERAAKALVVRVSGTLQRSIQTIYPGRPIVAITPVGARRTVRRLARPR